jgi:hypothetical protein
VKRYLRSGESTRHCIHRPNEIFFFCVSLSCSLAPGLHLLLRREICCFPNLGTKYDQFDDFERFSELPGRSLRLSKKNFCCDGNSARESLRRFFIFGGASMQTTIVLSTLTRFTTAWTPLAILAACVCLLSSPAAQAQTTYTWTRGSGTQGGWNNADNWNPTAPLTGPVAGDTAIVNGNTGTGSDDAMSLNNNRAAAQLVFTGAPTKWIWANGPGSTVTNARDLLLTNGILADATSGPAFVGYSNGTSWRNLVVRLNGNQSIVNESASTLSFGNPGNFVESVYRPGSSIQSVSAQPATLTFTGSGSGEIAVNGSISNGGSGAVVSVVVDRAGRLVTFNDSTSYSGGTTIQAGTLALGPGGTITHNALISVAADGSFDLSSKSAGLSFTSAQQLGGTGTVRLPSAATVTAPGNLLPGLAGTVGTLSFTGTGTLSLTNAAAGGLQFDLGTASDLVSLPAGTLDLGAGSLGFANFGFTPGSGFGVGSYTLFSASALTGSLGASISGDVGGLLGTLSVDGSNLVLTTAVPEPGTALLVLVAGAAAAMGRRRQGGSRA